MLSSGPWTKTHWKQCFIPFEKQLEVLAGEEIGIVFELQFRTSSEDTFVFKVVPMKEGQNAAETS
jgi:hypothetical protein